MTIVFAHRPPTDREMERLRLILSTYQDGSGMLADKKSGRALPGWRDFERLVALAFNGRRGPGKWIYDVILSDPHSAGAEYGISCKMKASLPRAERGDGRVYIEVSNAAGEFWDVFTVEKLDRSNYGSDPDLAGRLLVELVEKWHTRVDVTQGGRIDTSKSCVLSLQYDKNQGEYRLFQFPIGLPPAHTLTWESKGRRLIGYDRLGVVLDWYGLSGGRLKYYPLASTARWVSPLFKLEPLREGGSYGPLVRPLLIFRSSGKQL